jgi:phosphatidyl-myo-inositol dimannoside synthase
MQQNILYIHHNAKVFGGGEASLLALLGRLDRRRFVPYVLCTSDGLFVEALKKLDIKHRIVPGKRLNTASSPSLLLLLMRLTYFVIKNKIRVIHVNSIGRLHYLTLLSSVLKIRTIYHLRSLLVTRSLEGRTGSIINRADTIIAHCGHMKKAAIEAGLDQNKIRLIYNGIDAGETRRQAPPEKLREELRISSDTKLVGMAGRIVEWKGCDDFLHAAKQVLESVPDTKFVIAGDAPDSEYKQHLLCIAGQLDITGSIIFTGLRSDMTGFYAGLDVFVLPSWEEPFGRVTLEAMAAGRPIVGTDSGGTPEQIVDGESGALVRPGSPGLLAEKTIQFLRDKQYSEKIGNAARERASQLFSIERHVSSIEKLYSDLLDRKRILIYSHEFPPMTGGAGRYTCEIASSLSKLGNQVSVLTIMRGKDDGVDDHMLPFNVFRAPKIFIGGEKFPGLFGFIYRYFALRPSVILIADKWAQLVCGVARLIVPFKYYMTVHGSEIFLNTRLKMGQWRLRRWLFRRACVKAQKIFAVSGYTKKLLIEAGVDSSVIVVTGNGINADEFSRKAGPQKLKQKLGINGEKILLTLARLNPRKGQDMVIAAMPRVLEKAPDTKYVIVGQGDDRNRLRELADKHGLNGKVIFCGSVPDNEIVDYYDMCDVFVMPSRRDGPWVEGFGISFLEAAARAKPAIGGSHGGVGTAILDGETGLLVDPENPEEIAEAIISLLSDPQYARALGQAGRKRCFDFFKWEDVGRRIMETVQCG